MTEFPVFASVKASYSSLFSFIGANGKAFLVTFVVLFIRARVGVLLGETLAVKLGSVGGPVSITVIFALVVIDWALIMLISVPLLISAHRFWLVGEDSSVRYFTKFSNPRELGYVGYLLLLASTFFVPPALVMLTVYFELPGLIIFILTFFLLIWAILLATRMLVIFPAIALDVNSNLATAWDQTKGMTLRIIFINLLALIPINILFQLKTPLYRLVPENILYQEMILSAAVFLNLTWILLAAAIPTVIYKFVRDRYP